MGPSRRRSAQDLCQNFLGGLNGKDVGRSGGVEGGGAVAIVRVVVRARGPFHRSNAVAPHPNNVHSILFFLSTPPCFRVCVTVGWVPMAGQRLPCTALAPKSPGWEIRGEDQGARPAGRGHAGLWINHREKAMFGLVITKEIPMSAWACWPTPPTSPPTWNPCGSQWVGVINEKGAAKGGPGLCRQYHCGGWWL